MDSSVSSFLLMLSVSLYIAGFILHVFSFTRGQGHKLALIFMRAGFLISTFYLAAEAGEHGFFLPISGFSQALSFFAWSLAFVYLVLLVKSQTDSFGMIVSPFLILLTGAALITRSGVTVEPKAVLMHPYFLLHIGAAFFAYASFTLSFAAAVLYLIQHHELKSKKPGAFYHKLASLEELEKLVYQPVLWGTPLLFTAISVGLLWAHEVYGEMRIFDAKTLATALTAGLYGAILIMRSMSVLRGKQTALLSLSAFALVLFAFLGTRLIPGSHHYF